MVVHRRNQPTAQPDAPPLPFDIPEDTGSRLADKPPPAPRSVAFGKCPHHADTNTRGTGLIWQGAHLVWRLHTKTTGNGMAIQCDASGVPVCVLPPALGVIPRCHH